MCTTLPDVAYRSTRRNFRFVRVARSAIRRYRGWKWLGKPDVLGFQRHFAGPYEAYSRPIEGEPRSENARIARRGDGCRWHGVASLRRCVAASSNGPPRELAKRMRRNSMGGKLVETVNRVSSLSDVVSRCTTRRYRRSRRPFLSEIHRVTRKS